MDPFWKHQENTDPRHAEDALLTQLQFDNPSLTQQHFAKDADLNTIIKRYGITDGALPPMALNPEYFGDFTDAVDFREHLDRVRNAETRFNALPADLRAQFGNDMIALHDWVSDPDNAEEAVKIGLLQKQSVAPPPTPTRTETGKEEAPPPVVK